MASSEEFEDAARRVQSLARKPDNNTLLELYGLYKQASDGDVSTKRPGMLDVKGRAKWDAWSSRKGMSQDKAREEYVALVKRLER